MLDIQDKMGYVDTGPRLQQSTSNHTNYPVATSTSAHLVIKEPKPQRKVNLMNEPPQRPMTNEVKKKQQQPPPPPQPNSQSKSPSTTPRTEKNLRVTYDNLENRQHKRVDIKELMVHKLYELADMLQSLDVDEPSYPGPRPTPSKSDPQQQIKRRPTQRIRNQSPEAMSRDVFNKSADYIEPMYHRRPYYGYYDHPLPPQEVMYNDSNNDDGYYPGDEPYHYYPAPPPPPPQQQNYLRRRSYSNLRDIEPQPTRLIRKGSRGSIRFPPPPPPPPPPQQRPQYEPAHYDPRYDAYQEIPNTGRYHRSPYYPPYSPDEYY